MLAYEIAKKEVGVKEISGRKDNPRIIEYHAQTKLHATDDETPWCSSFVNWCVNEAIRTGDNCPDPTRSAMARSWALWGRGTKDPKEGDIVVFKRRGSSTKGHVAFFIKRDAFYVYCLGGNQNNQVCVAKYLRANVIAYRTI